MYSDFYYQCMVKKSEPEQSSTGSSVVLNGVMYELSDNPSHGVIRAVKNMNKQLSIGLIREHREMFTNDTPVQEALQKIFEENPEEFSEYTDATEEFEILGTLSLATNKVWTSDGIAIISEKELKTALEKCTEVLGGPIYSFL